MKYIIVDLTASWQSYSTFPILSLFTCTDHDLQTCVHVSKVLACGLGTMLICSDLVPYQIYVNQRKIILQTNMK